MRNREQCGAGGGQSLVVHGVVLSWASTEYSSERECEFVVERESAQKSEGFIGFEFEQEK